MDSKVVWKGGMAFDAELDGFTFVFDPAPPRGGEGVCTKPKGLVLTALAGCTAMDVASILTKMRVFPTRFEVSADAEVTESHPRVFSSVTLVYRFEGADLPLPKIRRAVDLSRHQYCGVSAMLGKAVPIRAEIWTNGERVEEEAAEPPAPAPST